MRKTVSVDMRDAVAMSRRPNAPSYTTDCWFAAIATTPGISLALTLACNALSMSSLWTDLLRGAAIPVKGAAGIMPADARAAVRNSASRRVIGPVICFEDETAGAPKGYD